MNIVGINPNLVVDSLEVPGFALGQLGFASDGTIWQFLKAGGAVDPMDVVIIFGDGTAQAVTATLGAPASGGGLQCGVAPESGTQAIAINDYFWACVYAPGVAGIKANMVASVDDFVELYTSGTAGALTDVFDGDNAVRGITSLVGDDTTPEVSITWPYIVNTIDS